MKNILFTVACLVGILNLNSQNVFNPTGDALLDGYSLKIEAPITTGGWARGVFHFKNGDLNTRIGGYGMLGTATNVNYLYMAHGDSPWASQLGLYIKPNGFTGIGTTDPSQKLELANGNLLVKSGNIYIKGAANDAGDLIFQKGTSGQLGRIWTQTTGDSGLYLSSGDNAPDLTIDDTGKIGVGTTNPSQGTSPDLDRKLLVNGGITLKRGAKLSYDPSYYVHAYSEFNSSLPESRFMNYGYYGHRWDTRVGTGMVMLGNNGNVGIGTVDPASKLHVEGRASVGKSGVLSLDWTYETNWNGSSNKWAGYIGFNANRSNEDAKDLYFGRNKYTNKGVFEGSNSGFRWLYRNRVGNDSDQQHLLTEYMRLDTAGNLGIGTTTPDSKLAVNGTIHSKEVKVDLIGWSDFVFYNDYKLPTLEEVENHIKEKGHLKDIPSAKEVEENGVFLGEMNSKLLQKIEELMLYTIQQQKKINELQLRLEKLENN